MCGPGAHRPLVERARVGVGQAERRQLARIQLSASIRVDLSELRLEHKGLVELVAIDRPAAVLVKPGAAKRGSFRPSFLHHLQIY